MRVISILQVYAYFGTQLSVYRNGKPYGGLTDNPKPQKFDSNALVSRLARSLLPFMSAF